MDDPEGKRTELIKKWSSDMTRTTIFYSLKKGAPTVPDSKTTGIRISAVLGWEGIECAMTRLT